MGRQFMKYLVILAGILGLLGGLTCDSASKKITFALIPKSLSNPYWYAVREGMNAAAEKLNVQAEFIGPVQADVAQQVNIIESLIARKIDGLAISPNDPDGIKDVIQRAMARGIPTLTFDSDSPESERLVYIGTNNYEAGREAGRQMIKFLNGTGKIGILTGGLGALNLNERIRGFREVIQEQAPAIEVVTLQPCNDDNTQALNIMEDVTRSIPDLKAWFITGCWPLVSPKEALLNALGGREDIILIGFDTVKEELELVQAGVAHAIIGQRPYEMGYRAIEILYEIAVHKKYPDQKIIATGIDVVTKENVDEFLNKR